MPLTKVIITVRQVLKAKYGPQFPAIEAELKRLVTDPRFSTKLLYLDDAVMMAPYHLGAISIPVTLPDCKAWIDAIHKGEDPQYLVIFGSQDVVPFQRLDNPLYCVGGDSDQQVPADLPYACNSPYSTNIANFTNPSRVVGRIPDIPGVADINYVRTLVDFIISNVPRPRAQYQNHIGISAQIWSVSTGLSLKSLFGSSINQHDYPPTPNPPAPNLQSLTHFINCHGALRNPGFYGEDPLGVTQPLSLHSNNTSTVQPGTIVAAECCYGVQLYSPQGIPKSIATAYMEKKAAVFMGSSSISYGEDVTNDLADILCQEFLQSILAGASTGRALLEARQRYLFLKGPHLNPYDLKTIAQFYILGDPSVQPVVQVRDSESTILNRRLTMKAKGFSLGMTSLIPKKIDYAPKSESLNVAINALLYANKMNESKEDVFEIDDFSPYLVASPRLKALADFGILPSSLIRFRIFGKPGKANEDVNTEPAQGEVSSFRVLMVKEDGQNILESRVYASK